jgi:multiple sugar transport system permease protein
MTRRQRAVLRGLVLYALAGLILVWVLIPILYIGLASVESEKELFAVPLDVRPSAFSLDSYGDALRNGIVLDGLANSAIIASMTTVLVLLIGLAAAYPLARVPRRAFRWWSYSLLTTQVVPHITLLIPVFLLFRSLDLLDSRFGLALVYTAFLLPFSIWILRNFLAEIPVALERAALIDGCTRFQAFVRVLAPIAAPGIAATAIFAFIRPATSSCSRSC